ncbi:hypothetical protein HPB49_010217 [Dermacentor silvarum]|uniref:Uncharacterized protein n=1 Tax=Dermacentor silvarum TaxID=543639 RepID=A0ACB8DZ05_DERSI|nr:hypothetical protein HPB49_010217 [Dermacentor silvarum]
MLPAKVNNRRRPLAPLQQRTTSKRLRNSAPAVTYNASAEETATAVADVASDICRAGSSLSSKVQHSYQLRCRIPRPPNAFMLFAKENRRSVAAMNPNENNQHVSNHLRKLWRSLIAADREPYQRKPPAFFHLRKYPDYVRNPPEACRRKEREHKVKQIASKLENDCSENQGSSQALPRPRPKVEEACSSSSNSICCHRRRRKETTVMKPLVPEAPRLHRPTTTVATAASARATARPYIVQRSSANVSARGEPCKRRAHQSIRGSSPIQL